MRRTVVNEYAGRRAWKAERSAILAAIAAASGQRVGVLAPTPEDAERAVERARSLARAVGADPSLIVNVTKKTGGAP